MDVDIRESKIRRSSLLKRVALGEDFVITEAGKPVARLVPTKTEAKGRLRFGSAKGQFTVPDDFNDPLPKEIEDLFW